MKSPGQLISDIKLAFGETAYPGDDNIVYDNTGDHLECNEIKESFAGKKWQEITFDIIRDNESALSFFSDTGFSYYLPVYLIECIEHYEQYDVLADTIVYHLTLPIETDFQITADYLAKKSIPEIDIHSHLTSALANSNQQIHNFIKRMSLFNKSQGKAINQFLLYLESIKSIDFPDNKPIIASIRYWFIYE
jgi:hypothetical protein